MEQPSDTSPKRADARKNVAAILEAATRCLARDPDASLAEIAREAGVGRVTLYGHFDSRSTLIARVLAEAMARTEEEVGAVDLGGDPIAAMERLLAASWRMTHRHGALVQAAEKSLDTHDLQAAHEQAVTRMRTLLRRGRRDGSFRKDMPLGWQVTLVQSILHGASGAVYRGEHSASEAAGLVVRSALAALRTPAGQPNAPGGTAAPTGPRTSTR